MIYVIFECQKETKFCLPCIKCDWGWTGAAWFTPFSWNPVVVDVKVFDEEFGNGGSAELLDNIVPFPLIIAPPSFGICGNDKGSGFMDEFGRPESGIRFMPLSAILTPFSIVEAPLFCCWSWIQLRRPTRPLLKVRRRFWRFTASLAEVASEN